MALQSSRGMALGRDLGAGRARKPGESGRGSGSPLYSAVCPLVYVLRVLGLAPYEFIEDTLTPSWVNATYSVIWLAIYTYIIYGIMMKFFYIDRGSLVLGHTETAKTILNYCVVMMDIFVALYSRKTIAKIWNTFQEYDEKVKDIGYVRSERGALIYVWSMLVSNLILWTLINRLGMYAFMQPWTENVSYMLMYIGSAASVAKFSGIVLLLGERLSQLNEIAARSLPVESKWANLVPVVSAKTIERLYDELMSAGEALDSVYSWSLLAWLGNLSFHSVSNLYFVINWILTTEYQWTIIYCLMTWITVFNAQLVLLNSACHYTSRQARAMGYITLSGKRWLYTEDRNSLVETSLHMFNRKLNFNAGGCFHVDLPLLRSITALMTTYLVILLQFE